MYRHTWGTHTQKGMLGVSAVASTGCLQVTGFDDFSICFSSLENVSVFLRLLCNLGYGNMLVMRIVSTSYWKEMK